MGDLWRAEGCAWTRKLGAGTERVGKCKRKRELNWLMGGLPMFELCVDGRAGVAYEHAYGIPRDGPPD